MLHIVLLILKIIGIIIAVLLGLVLLAIGIVLFVPIRYQGEAISDSPENSKIKLENIKANAKVSWLLHIVSAKILYENKNLDVQVKIFGKKLNLEQKESKEKISKEEISEEKILEEETPEISEEITKEEFVKQESLKQETNDEIKEDVVESTTEQKNAKSDKKKKDKKKKDKKKKDKKKKNKKKKRSKDKKTKKQKEPLGQKLKSIYTTIQAKLKEWNEKKNQAVDFVKNEAHQASLKRLKQELFRLLKSFKPKKLQLTLHFGFEDPSLTGKLLGVICMLYPFFEKNIDVTPDFQNQVLKGNIYIKGRIRCVHVLILILNMILDKNVRITVKDVIKIFKPEMLKSRRKKK